MIALKIVPEHLSKFQMECGAVLKMKLIWSAEKESDNTEVPPRLALSSPEEPGEDLKQFTMNLEEELQFESETTPDAPAEDSAALSVLLSLGASVVDREAFEAQFINNLQEQLDAVDPDDSNSNSAVEPQQATEDEDDKVEGAEEKDEAAAGVPSHLRRKNDSSILRDILGKGKKETEEDTRIRIGEMTPFGNSLDESSKNVMKRWDSSRAVVCDMLTLTVVS